jgi:TP901 family phage tail tape measure protein
MPQTTEISVVVNDSKAIATLDKLDRKTDSSISKFRDLGSTIDNMFDGFTRKKLEIKVDPKSKDTVKFTAQLTDEVGKLITATGSYNAAASKADITQIKLSEDFLKESKAADKASSSINKKTKETDKTGSSSVKAASSENKLAKETENAGNKAEKSSKAFGLLHTVFLRLAHTAISAVTRSFREALTEMKNVDSELVVVRKVSNASAEELEELRDRAYEVGAAYGVAASDYLNAAAEMTRAGYREQAGDLAELATKLQLVGDVSQETANQFLIATDKAYKMNGDMKKLSDTIDKLNEIDNNYATSIQKVADGIGILAPIASQTHVSFEQMAAALGTITAVTQRSGSESARALRSLFLNIAKDTSTEIEEGVTWTVEEINNLHDALKKYAPEVVKAAEASGKLINPMEAIGALAKSFEEGILDEQKLMGIVSGLGGKLRSSQLLALIQNWDMYNDMLKTTAEAVGSADREVQNALDAWDKKLQQLKNTYTQFVQTILDTDEIKGFIDAAKYLVESITDPDEFSDKFAKAFEKAISSLANKIPKMGTALQNFASTLLKGVFSALKKEMPTILQNLTEASKDFFANLAANLPEIAGDFFSVLGTLFVQSILNADLAQVIGAEVSSGIILAIPNIISGLTEGEISGASGELKDLNWLKIVAKVTGINGLLEGTARAFSAISNKDEPEKIPIYYETDIQIIDSEDATEDQIVLINDLSDSLEHLSDKLQKASSSLEEYKKALEGGEKGDTFKSIADAYKSAIEMLDKGLTGTNAYMSAVDLIFSESQLREWNYDYEKAAEYLKSDLFTSTFGAKENDFGAGFANYLRNNKEVFSDFVDVIDDGEDSFSLVIKDIQGLSDVTGFSKDVIWSAVDALDAYDSAVTYTREELLKLFGLNESNGNGFAINITSSINEFLNQGKTEKEIREIIRAIKELAKTDESIQLVDEPENLHDTITALQDIRTEADKDKNLEVVITSNAETVFDRIKEEIKKLDGSTIYIGLKYKPSSDIKDNQQSDYIQIVESDASGTDSARGGLSLVNEKGAEIIYANGKAWIAGGGDPTITNLPVGAGVFNAKQTREILARSGINSFSGTTRIGGIKIEDGNSSSGKKPSKNIEKILDEISKYIEKILKKAKEALDAQLKEIDAQIDALEREHDAQEDKNKLEELRLKILEAEKNLEEAKNERTVRYFNKETGQWEWMADQKAVHEAEEALKKAQEDYDKEVKEQAYQAQIQALKDLKEALEDQYNDLADHWDEIVNAIKGTAEKDVDTEKLLKKLGLDGNTTGSIRELIEAIQDYEKKLADGTYEIPLDSETTAKILSGTMAGSSANTVSQIIGMTTADTNARGTSMYSTSSSSVYGNTYYINGIKIGSDMMDKPLSQILSVLPIYAN